MQYSHTAIRLVLFSINIVCTSNRCNSLKEIWWDLLACANHRNRTATGYQALALMLFLSLRINILLITTRLNGHFNGFSFYQPIPTSFCNVMWSAHTILRVVCVIFISPNFQFMNEKIGSLVITLRLHMPWSWNISIFIKKFR